MMKLTTSMVIVFRHTLQIASLQFPIKEFFDPSNSSLDYMETYRSAFICNQQHDESNSGFCSCDEECLKNRDCCVDYLWTTRNYTNITHGRMILREMSRSERFKIAVCQLASPFAEEME